MQLDGTPDVFALEGFRDLLIIEPAITMAGDLPVRFEHRLNRGLVARQRERNAKHRDGQLMGLKQAMQPPKSGTRAIFVQGLNR